MKSKIVRITLVLFLAITANVFLFSQATLSNEEGWIYLDTPIVIPAWGNEIVDIPSDIDIGRVVVELEQGNWHYLVIINWESEYVVIASDEYLETFYVNSSLDMEYTVDGGRIEIIFEKPVTIYNGFVEIYNRGFWLQDVTINKFQLLPIQNESPAITSISADPSELWPPNKKEVDVTIDIVADDPDGTDDIVSTTYAVDDEYGEYNVPETELPTDGVILLVADRNGNDEDGRVYSVTITVYDSEGAMDTERVDITVLHDMKN